MSTVDVMTAHRKGKGKGNKPSSKPAASAKRKAGSKMPPSATTADPALSGKVLQGEILPRVGQLLDVHSLIAAGFKRALTTELAWVGSTYHVTWEEAKVLSDYYNPASLSKLEHLHFDLLNTSFYASARQGREAWLECYVWFLARLPILPLLQSLTGVCDITVQDLQMKYPQLRTLKLQHVMLSSELLTALHQMPRLTDLHLLADCSFELTTLVPALQQLSHVRVHMDSRQNTHKLQTAGWMQFLAATHHLTSLSLTTSEDRVGELAQEHPTFFTSPQAQSSLRTLNLTCYYDDEGPELEDLVDKVAFQFVDMYQKCVLSLLPYYPGLTDLTVTDINMLAHDHDAVTEYCQERGIRLTQHHHLADSERH